MSSFRKEARFDLRKGISPSFSQDILDRYEMRSARNARIGEPGSLIKTAGSQRLHAAAIGSGAKVIGMKQWIPAAGRELVAVSGGNFYHKIQTDTDFTAVASTLSTTVRPVFAPHIIAGTPTLFFADGALRSWSGSALTTSISGAPAATFLKVYKGRMFAVDGATKVIYWSDIADPTTWASPDGGQANVDTYSTEPCIGLGKAGDSLMIFKETSIARFTGVDNTDIQIQKDTQGISDDIGSIAPMTIIQMEEVVGFLTDRGFYVATEAGVQAIGPKIENVFDAADLTNLIYAVAVHHRARREVWVFFPATSGDSTNTKGYCFNYRQQAWTGPWDMASQFDVCSATEYQLNNRTWSVALGGYDGFVRRGDVVAVGGKHDVLAAGTGGANITMVLELPTLLFGSPGATKKLLYDQHIEADLKTTGSLSVALTSDITGDTQTVVIPSTGAGVKDYEFGCTKMFKRGTMTITDATSELVQINGIELQAGLFNR